METRIIFLMLTIIIIWVLINPQTRAWVKAMTGKVGGASGQPST